MGIFRRIVDAVRRVFSGAEVERVERPPTAPPAPPGPPSPPRPPAPPTPPGGDDFGDDFGESDAWNLPGSDGVEFDFALAGYLPLGGRGDDYVDVEGPSTIDVNADIPWADVDYVVVHVVEPDGTDYYTTIVGPFDDYDDFFAHLQTWWEEGSP